VRFEVLTALTVTIVVFRDVAPCSLVDGPAAAFSMRIIMVKIFPDDGCSMVL
jgi:hypothetical protein